MYSACKYKFTAAHDLDYEAVYIGNFKLWAKIYSTHVMLELQPQKKSISRKDRR